MKIYNEIILKWNDKTNQYDTVYEDSYDYTGEVHYAAPKDEMKGLNEESKLYKDLIAEINDDLEKSKKVLQR